MKMGDKLTAAELNTLMNSWERGTQGHSLETEVIAILDRIGSQMGYGAMAQFSQWLYETQCHGDQSKAANLKRERFAMLGWKLPDDFEKVAAK